MYRLHFFIHSSVNFHLLVIVLNMVIVIAMNMEEK